MKPYDFEEAVVQLDDDRVLLSDTFQVNIKYLDDRKMDGWVWLSIKRRDKQPINDWRVMQKIKNSVAGEDREGVELYPAEKRLVDTSNQFHIFVMPKGDMFPFGYGDRKVCEGHNPEGEVNSRQRHFDEGEEPEDCIKVEEMLELSKKFIEEKSKCHTTQK